MAHGHWAAYPTTSAIGSAMAILSGVSSFLLAMTDQQAAAWAALMVAGAGLATAVGGQLVAILRLWLDSRRLKEQLDEARANIGTLHGNIATLGEKAKRDRATISRNFRLIKGLMAKVSQSTVMEVIRIQDEKEAAEDKESPGKSLIIKPFDMKDLDDEVTPDYEPPSEHDLGLPPDQS